MPKSIHIYIHTRDAPWSESAHPRAANGEFGESSGGGSGTASAAVTLKGNELGDYSSMKELRQKAMEHAERFIGKKFKNAATGHEIMVTRTGIRHTISGSSDSLVRSIPAIPELLQAGKLVARVADKRADPNILAVETYSAPITIDGEQHRAMLVVKEYQDGRRLYDHGLVK